MINALIEADRVELLAGAPELVPTPSASGKGQRIARCPTCRIALWSHYAGGGLRFRFVRVGTLDDPDRFPPQIHIFTACKQPWVDPASGCAGGAGILRPRALLAGGQPRPAQGDPRPRRLASGSLHRTMIAIGRADISLLTAPGADGDRPAWTEARAGAS